MVALEIQVATGPPLGACRHTQRLSLVLNPVSSDDRGVLADLDWTEALADATPPPRAPVVGQETPPRSAAAEDPGPPPF